MPEMPSVQTLVPPWVKFYADLGEIVLRRWGDIHESKNEEACQVLRCDFDEVCLRTATDLPQRAPALSAVPEGSPTEVVTSRSVDYGGAPSKTAMVDLVSETQPQQPIYAAAPDAAAELLQGSVGPQTIAAPMTEPVPLTTAAAKWPFQLGREALIGLSQTCAEQLEHIQANPIRHARATLKSKTIEQRVQDHDFSSHAPYSTDQYLGDVFSLLVRALQSELLERGLLERCSEGIPKSASDPKKLHRLHYRRFADAVGAIWCTAEPEVRQQWVSNWLWTLFCTDRLNKDLAPADRSRWRICNASWKGFWVDDDEPALLVDAVVTQHELGLQAFEFLKLQ